MAEVTGHVFDIENDNFTLRNILEAPLLEFKEEIEVQTALKDNKVFLTFATLLNLKNFSQKTGCDILCKLSQL